MTKELDAAPGDIRSLKYRIHELEGEVIGYKRILDEQGKAKPVAVAHVGNMDHGWQQGVFRTLEQVPDEPLCTVADALDYGDRRVTADRAKQAALAQKEAQPVEIPKGYALVPIRATSAMEEVFAEEGWEWANVLAAAEAVTEVEYEEALEGLPQGLSDSSGPHTPSATDHAA